MHDVNKERLDYIQKKYGVAISSDINSVVNNDLVVMTHISSTNKSHDHKLSARF